MSEMVIQIMVQRETLIRTEFSEPLVSAIDQPVN